MSQVPAKISTTPAHRSCPKATRPDAKKVSARPTTVIWLGVIGKRPIAVITASARRRTHASNLVVNTAHLQSLQRLLDGHAARLLVDLQHLRRDRDPRVAPRLLDRIHANPAAQLPSRARMTSAAPSSRQLFGCT